MDEQPAGQPTLQDVADAVTDLGRVLARQQHTLDRLADSPRSAGPDTALLADLFSLHRDAVALSATARTKRERDGFDTMSESLSRLITGRGGTVVVPSAGAPFDAATMEAAEVVDTADPAADRTVDSVLEAGLVLTDPRRSLRAARVVVRRHRAD